MSDLLPPNATKLEAVMADFIASEIRGPVLTNGVRNAQTCPLPLLPYLAWELSVDDWDPDWDEARKREVVAGSVALHRLKGTRAAVVEALEPLGFDTQIEEWFQYGAEPGLFRVNVNFDVEPFGAEDSVAIIEMVNRVKPVRAHLDEVRAQREQSTSTKMGVGVTRTSIRTATPMEIAA